MPRTTSQPRKLARHPSPARLALCATATATLLLSACGGDDKQQPAAPAATLACDDSIKTGFKPDADTTVLLVKAFKQGEPLILSGTATAQTPVAVKDLCMVKLNVGPGNPGPADAPSTSPGIGIEIWLPTPTNWNQRLHVLGGGGWGGGDEGSSTVVQSNNNVGGRMATIAADEGAVSASTNTGHGPIVHGSFAMNPDGTIATAQWRDFAARSVHETAVKTKALAKAYYGSAPRYAYFDGGSMGGRQALESPQVHPEDFDGILVMFPAINWTRFITADLYPQVVYQQDLGGVALTTAQQNLTSKAAIQACDMVGSRHLGYILDPSQCRYDPTKDATVLCTGIDGNGGVVGASTDAACVNLAQATAVNKIWYGMTVDGSVPDPAVDNGWDTGIAGKRVWYGTPRGANYDTIGSPNGPFWIASDVVALELQDPSYADPGFTNATGNGASRWKSLTYAQLTNAYDRGVALQSAFSNIDANNPDLAAFKARGGKIVQIHGLGDSAITAQGSTDYFEKVAARIGGQASVDDFYRLYLVPAMGHGTTCANRSTGCGYGTRYPNGASNADADPPVPDRSQLYAALQKWVEQGVAPGVMPATSMTSTPEKSLPLCAYPKKISFQSGDPLVAASYICK